MDFPAGALEQPKNATYTQWAALKNEQVSVAQDAAVAAALICDCVKKPEKRNWLKNSLEALNKKLGSKPKICILGGQKMEHEDTPELVRAIAKHLAEELSSDVTIVTGGMPGVQKEFATACGDGSCVWNLLPEGKESGYGVGTDLHAGKDLDERKVIFGHIGDMYLTFEGGPGVAQEARAAFARGTIVLPFQRTGGASSGLMGFPAGALELPRYATHTQWKALKSPQIPVSTAAEAAAALISNRVADCLAARERAAEEEAEKNAPKIETNIVEAMRVSKTKGSAGDAFVQASFAQQLENLIKRHPYLHPHAKTLFPHPLQYWVHRCKESLEARKFEEALEHMRRVSSGLKVDEHQIAEAFRRFDANGSGELDTTECKHMCAYLGWGEEEATLLDLDKDGTVTLQEFQLFVGGMGGVARLFEQRRLRISTSRKDVCDYAGITVGSRVRAHYYVQGHKSRSWKEATVLQVGKEGKFGVAATGPTALGVLLEFGFGKAAAGGKGWRARQYVPPSWIVSSVEDASTAAALRECGIMDEEQAFWSLLLPETEMRAVEKMETCQRKALALVRAQAKESHKAALPGLRERFVNLGMGERELHSVFSWIQDLAPVVVHVHLDRMGAFLEVDEFYRNQFETKTSCGALDPENNTRKRWEKDLFGGAYDDAKPFERCKYGALNVMNDYRGVVSARQYGDSYLVLKDVRLRCTFASTDSGGIQGSRLAVLDNYAHVLAEYNDAELRGLVSVAEAAMWPSTEVSGATAPQVLRGSTEDCTMEWITMGFPEAAQSAGAYFFEVELLRQCGAPQVGFLTAAFEPRRGAACTVGVGDDEHGWAVDGQNATKWHGGPKPWGQVWESEPYSPPTSRYAHMYGGGPSSQQTALKESVTVGVLADLDRRRLWFATNGEWDQTATFELPPDVAVFPAISLKGAAAFNFGPNFSQPVPAAGAEGVPPDFVGKAATWPQMLHVRGKIRMDTPRIGNEEILSIYKEAQFHGEVSLKRNVQRLVAARKYLDMPKTQRSWALRVNNAGSCNGTYKRAGVHDTMALYKSKAGAAIYYDSASHTWRMAKSCKDLADWFCSVPADEESVGEPPRRGWKLPDEDQGVMPADDFRGALAEARMSSEQVKQLLAPLLAKEEGAEVVYRVRGQTSLQAEWEKLQDPPGTIDALWEDGMKLLKARLMREALIPSDAQVLESRHPYEAKRHSWSKEVCIEDAAGLAVHFYSKTCTLDTRTRFKVSTGGLSLDRAGRGARVEVAAQGGGYKVWGTVTERSDDGCWKVRLSRRVPDEAREEASEETSEEASEDRVLEDIPRYASVPPDLECFAYCREAPSIVTAPYVNETEAASADQAFATTIGHEIAELELDRSCPLAPVKVKRFAGGGPAQERGVKEGWYLDLVRTVMHNDDAVATVLCNIGGEERSLQDRAEKEVVLDACFANLEELIKLLNKEVRALSNATLVFTDSCTPGKLVPLPEVQVVVAPDAKLGDEISQLGIASTGHIVVEGFVGKKGAAYAAGVRTGWALNLEKCKDLKIDGAAADKEALLKDPKPLLAASGATLAFEHLDPEKKVKFFGTGKAGGASWSSFEVLGESAEFEFSSDGDGSSEEDPSKRWGVWALVRPKATSGGRGEETKETKEITITVEKANDTMYGIEVDYSSGKGIIEKINDAGLVPDWNKANPDMPVKVGDVILEVDGKTEDVTDVMDEIGSHSLKLLQDSLACCSEGHPLMPMTHYTPCGRCGKFATNFCCSPCDFHLCKDCYSQPLGIPAPIDGFEAFAAKWERCVSRATGSQGVPEVERESWDETRLRALCAKHGWEFEWMTEEGERRRRARERQSVWRLSEAVHGTPVDAAAPDNHPSRPAAA